MSAPLAPGAERRPTYAEKVAAAEAKYPGCTIPPTAWHANEIIKRLDRLIELAERQLAQAASR